MRIKKYEDYKIDVIDVEDSRIIIYLVNGPTLFLTAIEDHGYSIIDFDEEKHDNTRQN